MRRFVRYGLRLAAVLALASGGRAEAGYSFQIIDVPGAGSTYASGINGAGQIVGEYDGHGFLYSGGSFTTLDVPGADSTAARGINGAGQIVGGWSIYVDDGEAPHGFLATSAVPEPSALVLLGTGAVALLGGAATGPAQCLTPSGIGRSAGYITIGARSKRRVQQTRPA